MPLCKNAVDTRYVVSLNVTPQVCNGIEWIGTEVVCTYVCMYVCMYVCLYESVYVCMYVND